MLDIRLIRRNPAPSARRSRVAATSVTTRVDRVLELDERWRGLTAELEELRAEQNSLSKGRRGSADGRRARADGGWRPRGRER